MDSLMTKVITIILVSNQIFSVKELNFIGSRDEAKEPIIANHNGELEHQQSIDVGSLSSTVDNVMETGSNVIPSDQITSKRVELKDRTKRDKVDIEWRKKRSEYGVETQERIVNGTEYSFTHVPYLVQVLQKGKEEKFYHQCAGTLISYWHVLSVAHCYSTNASRYLVRYGSNCLDKCGTVVKVDSIVFHPAYLADSADFRTKTDLAVIKLHEQVPFNLSPRIPAKLPSSTSSNFIEKAEKNRLAFFIAGWGLIRDNKKSCHLYGAYVNALNFSTCSQQLKNPTVHRTIHMCSYNPYVGRCFGDSGGGLYRNDYIWGVISWGASCEHLENQPSVYNRVDTYLDFIREAMGNVTIKSPSSAVKSLVGSSSLFTTISLLLFIS